LFIQEGSTGKIIPYSAEGMASILKGHPEALNALNNKKNYSNVTQQLQAVADIFNQDQLLSKN
jgi:hypothetical protein